MGIWSGKYQEDQKSRLCREKKESFCTNFRSATPVRRQVTLLEKSRVRLQHTQLNVSLIVVISLTLSPTFSSVHATFLPTSPEDAPELRI